MARSKKQTITEEVKEVPQEVDYQKDIQNKGMLEIALETPEEKPAEEVKEEVKPEKPEEEFETVEFDPEQLKKEAVEQAKAEIQESLKGETKAETEAKKDDYEEFQKAIYEKEKRNPTYKEALEFVKDQALKAINEDNERKATKAKEEQEAQTKAQQTQQESTNKYIKNTLDELYVSGKLPKIVDKDNPDDYGIRVQNELFKTIVDVNTKRINGVMINGELTKLPPKTLKEIFYEDFEMPEREVAGADAPVNMGRSGFTPDNETEEINYLKDLNGKSFRQIGQAIRRAVGK